MSGLSKEGGGTCRALKPSRGTLEVPVTNWTSSARSCFSRLRTSSQNHWMTVVAAV